MTDISTETYTLYNKTISKGRNALVRNVLEPNVQVQNVPWRNVQCVKRPGPKGTQKYKWLLFKSIWKTTHFDANCMEFGYLLLKLWIFYVFKMATNGGRHFEITILKLKVIKPNLFLKACILIHIWQI